MVYRALLLLAGAAFFACLASCSGDDVTTLAGGGPVLYKVPWTVPETRQYKLTRGDEEIGSAELKVEQGEGADDVFTQDFQFPDRHITDKVEARANAETLAPSSVTRVVNSPDGERSWEAKYSGSSVKVVQRAQDGERTDTLDIPKTSYDTWTDLFLWRTVDLRQGYEVKYEAVVTAEFSKPDVISIVLKVTGLESVTVPAGTFETWRVEIRSGGRTQKAWIANNEERTLVRYDNSELVFDLRS